MQSTSTDECWPFYADDQLWISQQINSPNYDSDEDTDPDFQYSEIAPHAFKFPSRNGSHRYGHETIDEDIELTLPTLEDSSQHNYQHTEETAPLNSGPSDQRFYTVSEYNEILVRIMTSLFEEILTDNAKIILYYKLDGSAAYKAYREHAENLHNVQLREASADEKLALFVNLYNMMTIHITHVIGPPRNIWDKRKLMNCTYYQVNGHKYAPHSILNGILRSNRRGLEMLWKPFGKMDARLPLILPHCEPLIHFALNSGTQSTCPLRVYTCKNVCKELRDSARIALNADNMLEIDTKRKILYLSKIFEWYAKDFGFNVDRIVEWILEVMEDSNTKKKRQLETMYQNGDFEVDYIPYDWTFNGVMSE